MAGQVTRSRMPEAQQLEQARAKWTTSLTKILAELMVDQVHRGNKHNNLFNKKAWNYIFDGFYNKTGLKWDKEQLKNRYSVLRRQYATVKAILDQSDFHWDEGTGSITASDEIWAEYIKKHPDAEAVRSGGCNIYKELCTIFSEPTTNGKHEYIAASEEFERTPIPLCPQPLRIHREESSSGSQYEEDPNDSQTPQPTPNATACNSRRGRKGIDDAIADAILEMAASSKMRAAAIEQYHARYSLADCIRELDLMQGVDQQLYFAALDLFNKPNAREIFLSLKKDKRLTWLRHKCATAFKIV